MLVDKLTKAFENDEAPAREDQQMSRRLKSSIIKTVSEEETVSSRYDNKEYL